MVTREEIDEQYNQLVAQRDRLEVLSNQLAERMRQVRQALDALLGTVRDSDMLHAPPDVASSPHARQLRAEGSELVEQGKQIAAQQLQIVAQLNYLAQQRQQLTA